MENQPHSDLTQYEGDPNADPIEVVLQKSADMAIDLGARQLKFLRRWFHMGGDDESLTLLSTADIDLVMKTGLALVEHSPIARLDSGATERFALFLSQSAHGLSDARIAQKVQGPSAMTSPAVAAERSELTQALWPAEENNSAEHVARIRRHDIIIHFLRQLQLRNRPVQPLFESKAADISVVEVIDGLNITNEQIKDALTQHFLDRETSPTPAAAGIIQSVLHQFAVRLDGHELAQTRGLDGRPTPPRGGKAILRLLVGRHQNGVAALSRAQISARLRKDVEYDYDQQDIELGQALGWLAAPVEPLRPSK